MEQTNILVTGGCGFLGTAIVSALLETKLYNITALDINPPSLGRTTFPTQVHYVRASILDLPTLQKAFSSAQPAIVVHTVGIYPLGAARYSMKDKAAVFETNITGTKNVLGAAQACGARGLVYTSSVTVVVDELNRDFRNINESWPTGRADTSYGISKAIAESHVLASSTPTFPTCSLRPSPIFGPSDPSLIPTLHACIPLSMPFVLGNGHNLQDFVYVANVADAHVLAVRNLLGARTAAGHAFFVSNGEPVALRAFCVAVWKGLGYVGGWEVRVPEGLAWGVGWVAEVCGLEGFARGVVRDGCRDMYVDCGKAREVLGYVPRVGMEEGVRRSCEHFLKMVEGRGRR